MSMRNMIPEPTNQTKVTLAAMSFPDAAIMNTEKTLGTRLLTVDTKWRDTKTRKSVSCVERRCRGVLTATYNLE